MKIWFQNRRYKCKRQLSDKPLDSSNGMIDSPETTATTPIRKMAEDNIMSTAVVSTETEEAIVYHHDQPHPVLPPYSTLYNQHPAPSAVNYAPTYHHHQDLAYSSAPVDSGYYALMASNPANVGNAGQGFHQHSFSSSVRAW